LPWRLALESAREPSTPTRGPGSMPPCWRCSGERWRLSELLQ
jgi:hypothetical protein